MYILNHDGALVDIEKADCIHKTWGFRDGKLVFLIETDNGSEKEGFILGKYSTKEERDKAFENMKIFFKSIDMSFFDESESGDDEKV